MAKRDSESNLFLKASPSALGEYSTRGGISAKVRRSINPACSSSVNRMVSVEELISPISLLISLKRIAP